MITLFFYDHCVSLLARQAGCINVRTTSLTMLGDDESAKILLEGIFFVFSFVCCCVLNVQFWFFCVDIECFFQFALVVCVCSVYDSMYVHLYTPPTSLTNKHNDHKKESDHILIYSPLFIVYLQKRNTNSFFLGSSAFKSIQNFFSLFKRSHNFLFYSNYYE